MTVVAAGCGLAEGPLWLGAGRGLRWVDADRGALHSLVGDVHRVRPLTDRLLTSVNPTADGALLVTVDREVWRIAEDGSQPPTVLATLPGTPRFNDAKVGPDGRLWAGTVDRDRPRGGALWSYDRATGFRPHWTGVGHGNGLAWNAAADTLYFVDSGAGTLSRGRFDRGELGPPTVLLELPRAEGIPDGLTVDTEGDLWLAVWGGYRLLRLSPDGAVLDRVDLPERNVTSCAFTGPDLDRLAVTTAADDVDPAGPGGSVHLLDVGRRGRPAHRFGEAA